MSRLIRTRRERGFTIIELLVVIAIIGILSGLLMPVLIKSRNVANKTKVTSMIRDLIIAIKNFQHDYGDYPWPEGTDPDAIEMADVLRELSPSNTKLSKGVPVQINMQLRDYLEIPLGTIGNSPLGGGRTMLDIWNEEYKIRFDVDGQEPVVWSKGEDRKDAPIDNDPSGDNNDNLTSD